MSPTATAWLAAALLLMATIYVGAGFSLVFFQFPGAGSITAANYDERMGAQVRRATLTFTFQSILMLVGGIVLTVAEWDQGGYRYAPLAYTVLTVIATCFFLPIYPVNQRMKKSDDPAQFSRDLRLWIRLNTVRFGIWFGEWVAMAAWFVGLATMARR